MTEIDSKILDLLACLSFQVSQLYDCNKELLELLEKLVDSRKDSVFLTDNDRKLRMLLENTKTKITGYTYQIPHDLHEAFKKKCSLEGYSLQEGIAWLIKAYVDDTISVSKNLNKD